MCIDALGNLHATYYQNTSGGPQAHRMYDVAGQGWGPETIMGDAVLPHDYRAELASDHQGCVHALVMKDVGTSSQVSVCSAP